MTTTPDEAAAIAALGRPEGCPGLPDRYGCKVELRLSWYPSFYDWTVWSVLAGGGPPPFRRGADYHPYVVRRMTWDQTAVNDATTAPNPIIHGSEAPIGAEEVRSLLDRLNAISLHPFIAANKIGLDGDIYGIEVGDSVMASRLSWWVGAPQRDWQPLVD